MASLVAVTVELAHADARVPARATEGSAGYDLTSCEAAEIAPGARQLVDTGVRIGFYSDHPTATTFGQRLRAHSSNIYARIAPRSGLAVKGIDVAAGVCDSDYRGNYKVLLVNNSGAPFEIRPGDRIAQLIFEAVVHPELRLGDVSADATARGEGGFGSTGSH